MKRAAFVVGGAVTNLMAVWFGSYFLNQVEAGSWVYFPTLVTSMTAYFVGWGLTIRGVIWHGLDED